MASKMRQSTDHISWYGELQEEPYKYDLFTTLRFLDAWNKDKPRIGEGIKAADEAVVLRQEASMAFAPAMLSRFDPAGKYGEFG